MSSSNFDELLVYGYIKQNDLSLFIIPNEIIYIIILFYHLIEYFTKHGKLIKYDKITDTITYYWPPSMKIWSGQSLYEPIFSTRSTLCSNEGDISKWSTAYGNIPIIDNPNSKSLYKWVFESSEFHGFISIGISDSDKMILNNKPFQSGYERNLDCSPDDSYFYSVDYSGDDAYFRCLNEAGFSDYNHDPVLKHYTQCPKIEMIVDTKFETISFSLNSNEKYSHPIKFRKHKIYRMCISMDAKTQNIQLTQFKHTKY